MYAQGYFQYDSKKSGGVTISHLRFGKSPIQSQYLVQKPSFVALHKPSYIGRYDILEGIREGGTFLINCPWPAAEVFEHLTEDMQKTIMAKKIKVYTIDALKIAQELGLGGRINTLMQACFFKISGVLPEDQAISLIKGAIKKSFLKKGMECGRDELGGRGPRGRGPGSRSRPLPDHQVRPGPRAHPRRRRGLRQDVIDPIMHFKGDTIPVSKMSFDGQIPTATARLEKRGIAPRVPAWIPENCIQCNQCALICPHAAIRPKQIDPKDLAKGAPERSPLSNRPPRMTGTSPTASRFTSKTASAARTASKSARPRSRP